VVEGGLTTFTRMGDPRACICIDHTRRWLVFRRLSLIRKGQAGGE
jgi:hypothetical protein